MFVITDFVPLFVTVFLVALVVHLVMVYYGFDSPEDHIWFLQEVDGK